MRHLSLIIFLAAALAACNGVAIGPVDHSCAGRPSSGQDGSGCGGGGSR
jgi:hypothetical protein